MGSSKALLTLVLFMATIILISSEVAHKDIDENLDTDDGKFDTNGIHESKYRRGGYYGGPWRGGYGGYCRSGCFRWGYNGRCMRCFYDRGEPVEADVNVEPYN